MQLEKLKLGIFLDSYQVPAWVYGAIQYVVDGGSGEFRLVILNEEVGKIENPASRKWVYSAFSRLDTKLFSKQPDPFALKNSRDLLAGVPVLRACPQQLEDACFLKGTDVRNIREYQLDILIRFGFENLRCEALNLAKYGTWFYVYGDDQSTNSGPPGYWEVVEGQSETKAALMAAGGDYFPKRVLQRSNFFTYPWSPARHRSYYFWATTPFLQRQIRLLHQYGHRAFLQQTEKFNKQPCPEIKSAATPSNLSALRATGKISARLAREGLHRLFQIDQWSLLFSVKSEHAEDFGSFRQLQPARDRFWADPHVVWENGRYYVFVEEFSFPKGKGHISVIEIDESGKWEAPVTVLEEAYHLSYPFIFSWQGKYYMIPETAEHETIDVYECLVFPGTWKFKQSLMRNVKAMDSTLVQYGGRWWLFTAMAENEAAAPHVELFLFYADNPLSGAWTAHPQNPIVSDIRNARPAGDLFFQDGKLMRPSQDCSEGYGCGFNINAIDVLSETDYSERRVASVKPNWDKRILGTHTYARQRKLTMIDALTRRLK